MSESEKRKCYFIQYSDDFLYDPKVQKLYGIPNTGKASIAVYLQLMLVAAKNGGFIIHDPEYATLGEQLEPLFLYTKKEEIDAVIYYFSNEKFQDKYIKIINDIYTFIQAKTMTMSRTIGASNKAKQRSRQKADNVGSLSATCRLPVRDNNINNNSYSNTNTYTINSVKQLLSAEGITDVVADELIKIFGNDAVAEAYLYADVNMPSDVRTRTGFIIDCVKKRYKLSASEKTKLFKEAEFRAELDRQKQQKENKAAAIASAEAERNEAEEVATFKWWSTLTDRERKTNWEIAKGNLNGFVQQAISHIGIPNVLSDIPTCFLGAILPVLNQIRKEAT